jgi:small subunit ribosomal protein S5
MPKKKENKEETKKGKRTSRSKKKPVIDVKKTITKKKDIDTRKQEAYRQIRRKSRMEKRRRRRRKEDDEYDVRLVSIRRVAKTRAGGKRLRLSVMVVVGDRKGNIGIAMGKGKDVKDAQVKAVNKAKKKMIKVPLRGQTIPHKVLSKYSAAKVLLKPAAPGTGVIAGGPVRAVVEAAGIKDILSKELGSKNAIPNVYATFEALRSLKLVKPKDEVIQST